MYLFNIAVGLSLVALSDQLMKDPLKDFCRIFGHSTAVVDRRLYIDGGQVNWSPSEVDKANYTNTWMRYAELDENNKGFPQQYTNLTRERQVPALSGGTLWPDQANKVIYSYGGEFNGEVVSPFDSLLFYDTIYNTWNVSNATTKNYQRAAWGAGAVAEDRGQGYYCGGWVSNKSDPNAVERRAQSTMLVFDMLDQTLKTTPGPGNVPRAEGVLLYAPVGDGGLLIYFGGIEQPDNQTITASSMSNIFIYDIANNLWYNETASGEIPEDRRRFCAGLIWADDKSSFNIYLYGGMSIGDGVGYGDVYILTLPSFKWIKWWPKEGETFPHHSLSCNIVNNQMIIMGGTFPNKTNHCDVPENYGQHGLDLGLANKQKAKWAEFNPNVTSYSVPPEIISAVGGGPTGGATVRAPTNGFANRDVEVQFARSYDSSPRSPTRFIPESTGASQKPFSTNSKSNKNTIIGASVGGVVGGLVLVSVIVGLFFCCVRRRRAPPNKPPIQPIYEIDAAKPPSEMPASAQSPTMSQHPLMNRSPVSGSPQQISPYSSSAHSDHHYPIGSPPPHYNAGFHTYNQNGHQYSPAISDGSFPRDAKILISPTNWVHEMPAVRSPLPITIAPQPQRGMGIPIRPMTPPPPPPPPKDGTIKRHPTVHTRIDPYFVMNPPRDRVSTSPPRPR